MVEVPLRAHRLSSAVKDEMNTNVDVCHHMTEMKGESVRAGVDSLLSPVHARYL